MKLKTTKLKEIQFGRAYIKVDDNRYIESGYSVSIKMIGLLPGCRKDSILTVNHGFDGNTVNIAPLFGYGKHHSVCKKEFAKFIDELPCAVSTELNDERFINMEFKAKQYLKNLFCEGVDI